MRRIALGVLFLFLTLGPSLGRMDGQAPGRGPVFQVNSYTTYGQFDPSVAVASQTGNFVIVWESFHQEAGSYAAKGIFGRRFDTLGNPLAEDFQINTYTFVDQYNARVASDSAGNFVVVWAGREADDDAGIGARLFDSSGAALGSQFTVHGSTPLVAENFPAVARNDAGFVVVWQANPVTGYPSVEGMLFPSGAPPGPISVSSGTPSSQLHPDVAMDPSGSFFVSWSNGSEIRGRAFDPAGTPLGPEFQVNTYTTGYQTNHSVTRDGNGGFVVSWNDNNVGYPMRAQRYDASGNPSGSEKVIGNGEMPRIVRRAAGGFTVFYWRVGTNLFAKRYDDSLDLFGSEFQLNDINNGGTPVSAPVAADLGRHTIFAWGTTLGAFDINARRGGFPDWARFNVDERPSSGSSNQNGVIEVGERVMVDQAYLNLSGIPYPLTGTASNFIGPAGPTYTILDDAADYGTIATSGPEPAFPGTMTADCFTSTANCFEFEITGTHTPGLHWDATYDEALSESVSVTRTLHIGGSFTDVPPSNIFFKFIENLLHNAITAGGSCGGYCPTDGVKRQQMAVFLLKSKNGSAYVPPSPTGTVFADVPLSNSFAMWIEDLYQQGITGGCSGGPPPAPLFYCPDNIVNRQQMGVFLLKMKEGSTYDPPDCTGIFQDVTCTPGTGFSDWVEELYNRQITGGCVLSPLQYCPTNSVTRQQMAAFLVKNFGLLLYGP